MRWCYWSLVGLAVLGMMSSCSEPQDDDDEEVGTYTPGFLEGCFPDTPCAEGLQCIRSKCTMPCTTHADCGQGVCSPDADGTQVCDAPCTSNRDVIADWICLDGVPMPCAIEPCPENTACIGRRGCTLLEGAPCTDDEDCATLHCSTADATCSVAAGEPCTHENCNQCMTIEGVVGWTFCSRDCTATSTCGEGECIGDYDTGQFRGACVPGCIDECPDCSTTRITDLNPTPVEYCGHLVPFTCDPEADPYLIDGVAQGLCDTP